MIAPIGLRERLKMRKTMRILNRIKLGVAASEVLTAATELASQSQAMRREVAQFLLAVRAA